jgi:hypothetical protein
MKQKSGWKRITLLAVTVPGNRHGFENSSCARGRLGSDAVGKIGVDMLPKSRDTPVKCLPKKTRNGWNCYKELWIC